MKIGVPREIKSQEFRVGMTPPGVQAAVDAGHEVVVETRAGLQVGFDDVAYREAGATIGQSAAEVYACPMVVKVKEPQPVEYPLLQPGQILFTYLHLAPAAELTKALVERGIVGIAYETITNSRGQLPLLVPMSEVAGRLSVQMGAMAMYMQNGGRGILMGGVPGVAPARVLIIGGGVVGLEAARMALGLGADVTILDRSVSRLRELDAVYGPRLKTRFSDAHALQELCAECDLIVGAVLIPGKAAPKLITRSMLSAMTPGTVFVDVSIDQGGCAETSRPTTHSEPTYVVDGVIHYCVANMPSACARTATLALTNSTLEYVLEIARKGYRQALSDHAGLRQGLNVHLGQVTNAAVAQDLGYAFVPPEAVLDGG